MLIEASKKGKEMYFERYFSVILRILTYGEVDDWLDNISNTGVIFYAKTNNIYSRIIPTVLR